VDRIAVIGCGGSGKSRLARELGGMLGITPVHLDGLYYDRAWKPLDIEKADGPARPPAHRRPRGGRPAGRAAQPPCRAPQALVRPRWLAAYARTLRPPALTVPNMVAAGQPAPTFFGAYAQWAATSPPSWEDVAWLRQLWGGPFLVKGITRVDDAKRAVDAGATAISVSNHGGNDLDGTPATIRALPAVAAAVGGQVEVLLDGGVRRGGDGSVFDPAASQQATTG
jgi:hypothetical protein